MTPKNKYYSRDGINYIVLDNDGFTIRDATPKEAEDASKQAWERLWDGFGTGLDDEQ